MKKKLNFFKGWNIFIPVDRNIKISLKISGEIFSLDLYQVLLLYRWRILMSTCHQFYVYICNTNKQCYTIAHFPNIWKPYTFKTITQRRQSCHKNLLVERSVRVGLGWQFRQWKAKNVGSASFGNAKGRSITIHNHW